MRKVDLRSFFKEWKNKKKKFFLFFSLFEKRPQINFSQHRVENTYFNSIKRLVMIKLPTYIIMISRYINKFCINKNSSWAICIFFNEEILGTWIVICLYLYCNCLIIPFLMVDSIIWLQDLKKIAINFRSRTRY